MQGLTPTPSKIRHVQTFPPLQAFIAVEACFSIDQKYGGSLSTPEDMVLMQMGSVAVKTVTKNVTKLPGFYKTSSFNTAMAGKF